MEKTGLIISHNNIVGYLHERNEEGVQYEKAYIQFDYIFDIHSLS